MELDELKTYVRIDTDEEDEILHNFQQAAEEYLSNAGAAQDKRSALYQTAVKMFVNSLYENRDIIGGKDTLSMLFKTIIGQLASIGGGKGKQ